MNARMEPMPCNCGCVPRDCRHASKAPGEPRMWACGHLPPLQSAARGLSLFSPPAALQDVLFRAPRGERLRPRAAVHVLRYTCKKRGVFQVSKCCSKCVGQSVHKAIRGALLPSALLSSDGLRPWGRVRVVSVGGTPVPAPNSTSPPAPCSGRAGHSPAFHRLLLATAPLTYFTSRLRSSRATPGFGSR